MYKILHIYSENQPVNKTYYLNGLQKGLANTGYLNQITSDFENALDHLKRDVRIHCIILDWSKYSIKSLLNLSEYNPQIPIFAINDKRENISLELDDYQLNLDFLQFNDHLLETHLFRISKAIQKYKEKIIPPFTLQLMKYASENNNSYSTPGHQSGHGFQRAPAGAIFFDFYGANVFKTDISVSMAKLGSLLEHSGPHQKAEEYIEKTFGSDRSFIVTNGTSTSNKIVGMYAIADGDTILVDRNCHKSIAHLLMMVNANPVYLKPTRNNYGLLGGIPMSEFESKQIQKKLDKHKVAKSWPTYTVITNSTYDGLFYNTRSIVDRLEVKTIHFDSAWVAYTPFHPIYKGKYGLSSTPKEEQTIIETQSTHKLLAAFSQSSMIHIKGKYDNQRINEAFMMHTSTSPFYPIVASCEVATAMLSGPVGTSLISEIIDYALDFRREIIKLKSHSRSWFFDVWQPKDIDERQLWPLYPEDTWHGFENIDRDHMYLDPLKVTLLLPGLKDNKLQAEGIPAAIVSSFLEDNGIIIEKTGPYSILFLFSLGITRAKSMRILTMLNKFKQFYDQNFLVEDCLTGLYSKHPNFYKGKTIKEITQILHKVICKYDLPKVMYHAFDNLPEFVMNPHNAYQKFVKGETKKVLVKNILNETSAVMVLPYPPGIPIIMPGEKITKESKTILEYLLMLIEIGQKLPGFETEIHGIEQGENKEHYITVLK